MKYNGFTNAGSIYQAKCKANELPIKFVKVKVGNGLLEETEDPAKFIDIKSLKKEVGISEKTQIQDAVRLTIQMDNDGVNEGYFPREFGIYVEDEGVEVLYWYVNDGNEASYLPSQNTAPVKLKNHFNIIATSLESLIVNWDGKEFWVDKEYLGKELAKKEDKIEIKESAFNRPFGTLENEVLEGIQLARTLGLEYGGELNNSNIKTINTVYYDTQNKSFFKCFRENTLNYADSNYYEGISNNDLLLKLQNLPKVIRKTNIYVNGYPNLKVRLYEYNTFFYIVFETLMYVPKGVIISLPDWNFPSEYAISTNLTHDWPTNNQEFGSIRYEKIGIRVVNNIPESSVGYILIPKFV